MTPSDPFIVIEREECPEHGDTLAVTMQRHPLRYCVTCSDFITPLRRRYVPHDALATALVSGVEVAGKVRDANQAERRRLEAENRRLREALESTSPRVVRRQRGVALPAGTVYVGRPTAYGNPFVIGKDGDRTRCVELYREWMTHQPGLRERARRELRGKDLACWCAPEACHADVLLEIANSDEWRA